MKTDINEFLNEQIEMVEELCGELTTIEKENLKNDFFRKFENIASELHVDVDLILDDFDLMIPIYESDFDMEVAVEVIGVN
ncbi:MAG: hypothetical protein IJH63_00180 [Methanobrevibacter sp.]|nr:hypothetical protein [Methanosphaera sp.]MBR0369120.1 hypothetical protein [Methanobrevibacter sp.]